MQILFVIVIYISIFLAFNILPWLPAIILGCIDVGIKFFMNVNKMLIPALQGSSHPFQFIVCVIVMHLIFAWIIYGIIQIFL